MLPLPAAVLCLVLVIGLPLLWLGAAAIGAAIRGDNGLAATMLPTALRETATLMLTVGLATGVLGLLSAWLVTHFEFPLRRVFDWALILPLAVPTYLAAYTYVEFLDFTGPVQQMVRALTGATTIREYWFPDIRSNAGAALVFSLVLYPYVYVACRGFFLLQSASINIAARLLGAGGWRRFFAITLPVSRPALVVGVTLAMLEVVNDLGAVLYFGVNSLTAVIYSTWINRSNFGGAAQLAVVIVLMIGLIILAEQWARRDRVYSTARDARVPPALERLSGVRAVMAFTFCGTLVGLGFGIPFGMLLYLALRRQSPAMLQLTASAATSTVLLASLGALLVVALGFYAARRGGRDEPPLSQGAIRLATLGYAIPGTVLALGVLQPLGAMDLWVNRLTRGFFGWTPGLILSGSVAALLYVYLIRFLAVSHSNLEAGMRKRGESVLHAARVLGAGRFKAFLLVDLPTLLPAVLGAATLVFVEIVKELPATLLLRPLGLETLATLVYGRASAGLFTEAALPALAIVLVGLVPVIIFSRLSSRQRVLPLS